MNKFEKLINTAPKIEDWYDQRTLLYQIVVDTIKSKDCKGYNMRRTPEYQKAFMHVVTFQAYGIYYLWIDYVIDNDVYFSHLEKFENDMVILIYSSNGEKQPVFPKIYNHLNYYDPNGKN